MGTSLKKASSTPALYTRGEAFGIPGEAVDGMDVLAVKNAGLIASKHCRSGNGPYILEMNTYRYRGHSMSDPAKYRTREEVQKMKEERDPITNLREKLLKYKNITEEILKSIDKEIKSVISEAATFSIESKEPNLSELWTDVYA